ncbi:MAG: UDP-N-acetylmuramate--L-alanine ligase [Streptosporangiales bacterium]|nr:UDP-N-acetylmuramate--L-alanine ligase [Streptosporangiales bacterium]
MSGLLTPVEPVPVAELGRVHLIGVGGAGMSGIARILLARGVSVSGSDAMDSAVLAELRALGATVHVGHAAGHLGDATTVVVSSAVRETNPEFAEARRRGLRVLPRAAALASVMAGRRGIAVAGTHGKTTTTSMLTVVLQHLGADPSFAIGGQLTGSGAYAHEGGGEIFVAEADESDGSFLMLSPDVAVVTNVEADHLDNYGTAEAVHGAFERFVDRVRPGGRLVACADDPGARALAERARRAGLGVRTYGESVDADVQIRGFQARGLGSAFEVLDLAAGDPDGFGLGSLELRVPGRHNALNATAALTAALDLGFGFEPIRASLAGFAGTHRRFELLGEAAGVRVFDSYAHHPTELAADLRTAREVARGGRVVAAFQPHLYSRTRFFAKEFGEALGLADDAVVLEVYAAREDPEPGVTGELVAEAVPLPAPHVTYQPVWRDVPKVLADRAKPGDIVLLLGAGDITLLGPALVEELRGRSAAVGRPVGE